MWGREDPSPTVVLLNTLKQATRRGECFEVFQKQKWGSVKKG